MGALGVVIILLILAAAIMGGFGWLWHGEVIDAVSPEQQDRKISGTVPGEHPLCSSLKGCMFKHHCTEQQHCELDGLKESIGNNQN